MGKLEETFNLPETIASLEETAQNIIDQFDTDEPTEYENLVNQYKDVITDITIDDLVDIRIYDKEMDELSTKTLHEFDDLMIMGKDVEVKHAGEIFAAAAQMAKIALDARTNKMDARLKLLELGIRKKRNDLLEEKQKFEMGNSQTHPTAPMEGSVSRDEIMAEVLEVLRKKKG